MVKRKMDLDNNDDRDQIRIHADKQIQQQYMDYKDVTDVLMSLLSTAEAIALQNSNKRELGYYDEYDTANRKGNNSQIIQLLRLIREFSGMRKDYNSLYVKKKYQLPDKITPQYIKNKIDFWKKSVKPEVSKYFDEIIHVLNGKPEIDINKELKKYYDKNIKLTEEQQERRWDNVIGIKHNCSKEDEELIKEYLSTGKYVYKVKFNEKVGRRVMFLYNKQNMNECLEFYL